MHQPRELTSKIKTLETIQGPVNTLKTQGKKIVFTNGCFDILHAGHVDIFQQARNLGDILVVGVNSDTSIKKIKGDSRPVVPQNQRLRVLAALESVDYVIAFDEDTPYRLIAAVAPDILVKGGDWPVKDIIGRDIVEKRGGKVLSIPLMAGISTTRIIEKIQEKFCS